MRLAFPEIEISKQLAGTVEKSGDKSYGRIHNVISETKIKLKVLIISSIITEFCFLQKYKCVKLQILQEKNHKKKIKRKSATSLIFDYSEILLSLNEPPGLIILC